jgi:hypothetical protein
LTGEYAQNSVIGALKSVHISRLPKQGAGGELSQDIIVLRRIRLSDKNLLKTISKGIERFK